MSNIREIASQARPICYLCGAEGSLLYSGVTDALFDAPGEWSIRKCCQCGLLWLDPQPVADDLWKAYARYYTHEITQASEAADGFRSAVRQCILAGMGYHSEKQAVTLFARTVAAVPLVRNAVVRQVMGLHAESGARLLDVGCGNGTFLANMKDLGWRVLGVEIDENAAQVARQRYGLEVLPGTLAEAEFPDQTFDVVTLRHVIEHVFDPVLLLGECARVLKPGGRLLITTPNVESLAHALFRENWRGLEPPRHLMLFSPATLAQCAEKAGFRTCENKTNAAVAHGLYFESRAIRSRTNKRWSDAGMLLKIECMVFQLIEELVKVARKNSGEELCYVGVKDNV